MKLSDAFPSKFLKEEDLQGRSVGVTIKLVDLEEVGQKKDRRLVAYFSGMQKGLVLNKTNAKKIAEIARTDDTDDWRGVKIVLYPSTTTFAGEETPCIRVKAPSAKPEPAPKPEALPWDSSDDDDREPREPGFDLDD